MSDSLPMIEGAQEFCRSLLWDFYFNGSPVGISIVCSRSQRSVFNVYRDDKLLATIRLDVVKDRDRWRTVGAKLTEYDPPLEHTFADREVFLAECRQKIVHGVPGLSVAEQRRLWELASGETLPAIRHRSGWEEDDAIRHGVNCMKVPHNSAGSFLHDADDDTPYEVDGVAYCGRCHRYLRREAT